ncbi:hypothetical protein NPIL_248961 [Nephila pilipes]|uniref:Uncharacterized protein n=1 Tax=Nephila pilipes TaxID=299642 RepID=A0A8X6P9I6_NEPPI|nr:hypothetical protein NPIL_248961 [Nephila pilipes]
MNYTKLSFLNQNPESTHFLFLQNQRSASYKFVAPSTRTSDSPKVQYVANTEETTFHNMKYSEEYTFDISRDSKNGLVITKVTNSNVKELFLPPLASPTGTKTSQHGMLHLIKECKISLERHQTYSGCSIHSNILGRPSLLRSIPGQVKNFWRNLLREEGKGYRRMGEGDSRVSLVSRDAEFIFYSEAVSS